jgi:hypothetical protein
MSALPNCSVLEGWQPDTDGDTPCIERTSDGSLLLRGSYERSDDTAPLVLEVSLPVAGRLVSLRVCSNARFLEVYRYA